MIKVFISQPMRGKTDEEILAVREKAIVTVKRSFKGEEVEVLDSFFKEHTDESNPLEFLARSIALLGKADIAYFAKGWEQARGCRIENQCTIEYGIGIIEE